LAEAFQKHIPAVIKQLNRWLHTRDRVSSTCGIFLQPFKQLYRQTVTNLEHLAVFPGIRTSGSLLRHCVHSMVIVSKQLANQFYILSKQKGFRALEGCRVKVSEDLVDQIGTFGCRIRVAVFVMIASHGLRSSIGSIIAGFVVGFLPGVHSEHNSCFCCRWFEV